MNKGFTMVELLAAIVILAGIMIIAVPAYGEVSATIKQTSLENKEKAITTSMLNFANKHLIDDIKTENNDCSVANSCCRDYDLYKFVTEYGIYTAEDNNSITNPVTNGKLTGCIRVIYDVNTYSLKANFIENCTLSTADQAC